MILKKQYILKLSSLVIELNYEDYNQVNELTTIYQEKRWIGNEMAN